MDLKVVCRINVLDLLKSNGTVFINEHWLQNKEFQLCDNMDYDCFI